MASTIQVSITRGNCKSEAGGALQVPQAQMIACELVSDPVTSQTTTMSASAAVLAELGATNPIELMWRVFIDGDTNIAIKAATTPTANASTSPRFRAETGGIEYYLGVKELNEKLAFINV